MTEIINLSRIQETSDGDLEFEQDLIQMYLEDAAGHIVQIGAHFDAPATTLRNVAHTLKGSSANIGANAMRDAAYAVEKHATGEVPSTPAALTARLEEALRQTREAYHGYLMGLGLTPR